MLRNNLCQSRIKKKGYNIKLNQNKKQREPAKELSSMVNFVWWEV